jgi:transposase
MGETEMVVRRHEISDNNWERVKDLLPPENTGEGRPMSTG